MSMSDWNIFSQAVGPEAANAWAAQQGGGGASPVAMTPQPWMQYYPQTFDDPSMVKQPSGTQDWNIMTPQELQDRQNGTGGYPTGSRDAVTMAMLRQQMSPSDLQQFQSKVSPGEFQSFMSAG
jgi:hypothetical protein